MTPAIAALLALAAAAIGAVVAWLAASARAAAAARAEADRAAQALRVEAERAAAAERAAEERETARARLEAEAATLRAEVSRLGARLAEAEARAEGERRAAAEKLAFVEEAKRRLADEFRALWTPDKAEIQERIRSMIEAEGRLTAQMAHLSGALRGPTTRGRWGEVQLRRIVELAGMVEHCDFAEQETVGGTAEGERARPDMIVRLPGGRTLAVDAKAPDEPYLAALEAADEDGRAACLERHAAAVRSHVESLARREYWDRLGASVDFVVLFLGEAQFRAALERDPDLFDQAVKRRVILATPTTLVALLRGVAWGWRQARLAENAERIRDLGAELYERIATFAGHLDGLRRALEGAVEAHNKAVGTLETRVLVSARRFAEWGVEAKKEIPPAALIEKAVRRIRARDAEEAEIPAGPAGDDVRIEARQG